MTTVGCLECSPASKSQVLKWLAAGGGRSLMTERRIQGQLFGSKKLSESRDVGCYIRTVSVGA